MDEAKQRILDAASRLLLSQPGSAVTVQTVAKEAGTAKGLIAYHFGSKKALFALASDAIVERHRDAWLAALGRPSLAQAVDACWQLVRQEASDGTAIFCVTSLTDWSANTGVATSVGRALVALLRREGRRLTIPDDEFGAMGAVNLLSLGPALAGGIDARVLEAAHSAFWAAAFGLTEGR